MNSTEAANTDWDLDWDLLRISFLARSCKGNWATGFFLIVSGSGDAELSIPPTLSLEPWFLQVMGTVDGIHANAFPRDRRSRQLPVYVSIWSIDQAIILLFSNELERHSDGRLIVLFNFSVLMTTAENLQT